MSVSNKAKRRGTILDEIMRYQREKLPQVMRDVPLADIRAFASVTPPPNDFRAALRQPGVSLIAECKKASPSKGLIDPDYDAVALAQTYRDNGAVAISVLTDSRYFQGSLSDLRDVREMLDAAPRRKSGGKGKSAMAVLRKDFIFHPYQVYEARVAGADAILLIAAVLESGEIASLAALARDLKMDALIEVHDEDELGEVLALEPEIIGVNNRNLKTFEVDLDHTSRLRDKIPAGVTIVAESGIKTADDVRRMKTLGIDAVLVGTSLVRSKNRAAAVRALVEAGRA